MIVIGVKITFLLVIISFINSQSGGGEKRNRKFWNDSRDTS